tara:strand:+ start:30254 stop:30817 length:564 start_codon:yes stop_codon:yes gene_type:complete
MAHSILSRTFSDVVDVAMASQHLRLWDDSESDYVQNLIGAAIGVAEKYMGRLIAESTVIAELSTLEAQLPLGKATSVNEVTYVDYATEERVTLDPSQYAFNPITNKLVLKREVIAALRRVHAKDYQVTFVTGWKREEIPLSIKQGILLLVATMYEMREDAAVGQGVTVTTVPVTHKYLFNQYKIYQV